MLHLLWRPLALRTMLPLSVVGKACMVWSRLPLLKHLSPLCPTGPASPVVADFFHFFGFLSLSVCLSPSLS